MENNTQNSAPEAVVNKNANNLTSIVVVICIIAIGVLLLIKTEPKQKVIENSDTASVDDISSVVDFPHQDDHILGDLGANSVVIIEYSDTECPYCKRFHSTMHAIVSDNPSKVAWVYRHFPIEQLHSKAPREALATECAADQGGDVVFWQYTDEIYNQTNSNDSLPDKSLTDIASSMGLDMSRFQTCLKNETFKNKVDAQILSGQKIGVLGTPTSVIVIGNKVVGTIKGAQPYAQVMEQIKKYLQ